MLIQGGLARQPGSALRTGRSSGKGEQEMQSYAFEFAMVFILAPAVIGGIVGMIWGKVR